MNMDLFTPVDLYCERTGPELWSEPVNALTNLAFVAAGIWGVYEVRKRSTGTAAEALAWWVVAIGVGSAIPRADLLWDPDHPAAAVPPAGITSRLPASSLAQLPSE
jgi:hypothetical protein